MAYQPRPGVEVEQQITPAPPTILTPALNPCLVGPCFAITSPLLSTGEVDPQTEVSIPAVVKGTSVLGDVVAVASEYLAFTIDDNDVVVVQLPAVATGSNLPVTLLPEYIQSKVPGLDVELVGGRLVFTTLTRGKTSRIRMHSKTDLITNGVPGIDGDSVMAYADLALDTQLDENFYGQGPYTNKEYTIPYHYLPTLDYQPDGDKLVFEGEEIDIYRLFLGELTKLSTTGAVNWTPYLTGDTKINNTDPGYGSPATTYEASLYGKVSAAAKTNRVLNAGKDASVFIPLPTAYAHQTSNFPDGGGNYYIYAEAKGSQEYLLDQTKSVGAYAGAAGNTLNITFTSAGAVGSTVTVDAASINVTIEYYDDSTYADLEAGIAAASSNLGAKFYEFGVVYPSGEGATLLDTNGELPTLKWYLSGGMDPVDFSSDGSSTSAVVTGQVVISDALVASLVGKILTISVDGGSATEVTIPSTMELLKDAIDAVSGVTSSYTTDIYSTHEASQVTVGKALSITTDSDDGHDSTLEISGPSEVIEGLFSGYLTTEENLADGSGAGAVATSSPLAQGTDYNLFATTALEKAIKPTSVEMELGGVLVKGHAISYQAIADMTDAASVTLTLAHSAFDPDGVNGAGYPFDISFTTSTTDPTDMVANIRDTGEAGSGLTTIDEGGIGGGETADDFIGVAEVALADDGTDPYMYLVFYDKKAVAGAWIKLLTSTEGNTTPAFQTDVEGSGSYSIFGRRLYTQTLDISWKDDPTNAMLAYLDMPSTYQKPSGWSYLKQSGTNEVEYAAGNISYALEDVIFYATSWTQTLTYTRGAANAVNLALPDYVSTIWTGESSKVVSGDRMYSDGEIVGTVVKIEDLSVPGAPAGWGTGAVLVLNAEAVENGEELDSWYIRAENLAQSGGRVAPELVYNDTTQELTIKHGLNRGTNGVPATGQASLYAGYKALRLDVTPEDDTPGILIFEDMDQVVEQLGPLSLNNPLVMGLYFAFLNSPNSTLSALGVAEVTENAPEGTVEAYQQALDLLTQHEVYVITPLTHNDQVHQLVHQHCVDMSEPEGKKERVEVACPALPTEEAPTLVASATGVTVTETADSVWEFDFGATVNFTNLLNGKVDANGAPITAGVGVVFEANQGIYVTRTGDPYRYLVDKQVSTQVLRVRTNYAFDQDAGPGTNGNDDGFYHDDNASLDLFPSTGETCSVSVRNAAIDASDTAGKLLLMETLAAKAATYASRRMVMIQPENVGAEIDGLEVIIPGYHLAAAVAGMVGFYSPSQPFTNLPMTGFTRPVGSSDRFNEAQMGAAASGGIYWIIQDSPGAPLISRHQLTTNMSSVKTREFSVTRAVDASAKRLRAAVKSYIGRYNITQGLLNTLNIVVTGVLKSLVGSVVADASLDGINIVATALDEIAIDVTLTPFYPANKISIRIVI